MVRRRVLGGIGGLALFVVLMCAIVASPLAMLWLAKKLPGTNWVLAADIGQSYGLAAAALSALAFLGVLITIVFQLRQDQADRRNSARTLHQELLNSALSNNHLLEVWRQPREAVDSAALAQRVYINMTVSQWDMLYGLGMMSEEELELNAKSLFASQLGRYYWSVARRDRQAVARSSREKRFVGLLDRAYQVARSPGSASTPNSARGVKPIAVLLAVAGLSIAAIWSRRIRRAQ